jgi:hypothetical protein
VSQNASADLVFGVPLGGSDEGWLLTGPKDRWGEVRLEAEHLPWLTPAETEEFDDLGYGEILELGLAHLATLTSPTSGDPLSLGLTVHYHGYELNSFALVLREPQYNVSWGGTTHVDYQLLRDTRHLGAHHLLFAEAFAALNLQPEDPEPRWFMTCEYC